jgi:hypothetical protein
VLLIVVHTEHVAHKDGSQSGRNLIFLRLSRREVFFRFL